MIKNLISEKYSNFYFGIGLVTLSVVAISIPSFVHAETLNRQLEIGMSGSDVSAVQTFLAQDKTLYPQGLVTGYFGDLTKIAVANFQSRNNISAVGRIGPVSLPVFNMQMSGMVNNGSLNAPLILNVNTNVSAQTASISWTTDEPVKGVVYYSNFPLTTYERVNSVDVSGIVAFNDNEYRNSQSIAISGLQANTIYYYLIYVTDRSGNVSVTWPTSFRTNY